MTDDDRYSLREETEQFRALQDALRPRTEGADVSDVKRYKLINGLFQPRNPDDHARFSGEQRVVFASDYDALEADRDQWRNQARIGVECQFDEGKKYEARIRALKAALRGLLDAFKTDEIDDFTAYAEPIPTAIHAARAVLAADEREGERT
jgi:hypothetical protein